MVNKFVKYVKCSATCIEKNCTAADNQFYFREISIFMVLIEYKNFFMIRFQTVFEIFF